MRVVFCGGGTGGHVYPALTVANALRASRPETELLYVGVKGRIDEELVRRESIAFAAVTAGPLRVGLTDGLKGAISLLRGTVESLRLLRRFRPDVVFATGGYGSAGVGIAARMLRLPLLVFLPDVAAGMAVKLLARLSTRVAVTVEPALAIMPQDKTTLTGYPVRPSFFNLDRGAARSHFGLDSSLPVLLVTGGSTGASAINQEVASWLPEFLEMAQVLHVSGRGDEPWLQDKRSSLPESLRERYQLHGYLHDDMPLALAAADVGVMRAGASTIGELPATRLPSVLIPGGFSDQKVNAEYLEQQGAALMLPQVDIARLRPAVEALMRDDVKRSAMRAALGRLSHPEAPETLAALITEVARK